MADPEKPALPDLPLPRGLAKHRRQYRARAGRGSPWAYFGTDYAEALRGYGAWKQTGGKRDSIAWLLDYFTTTVCAGKVKAKTLAPRTASDYAADAGPLKKVLGHIPIRGLEPRHVDSYAEARAQTTSHARHEVACLSAAMAWAVAKGYASTNPCRAVQWPTNERRMRLVPHDEYLTVYARAIESVTWAMTLAVRTLAQPADLLRLGPQNIVRRGEQRVLRFARGKTKRWVEVEIVGELARVIDAATAGNVAYRTFIRRRDGGAYTVDGIGAMFRRYCVGTKKKPTDPQVQDFGLRDLRAKGATDMHLAGVDIRHISALLGHATEAMTRVYIKSYLPETVRPNEVPIVASVKA